MGEHLNRCFINEYPNGKFGVVVRFSRDVEKLEFSYVAHESVNWKNRRLNTCIHTYTFIHHGTFMPRNITKQ